MFCEDVVHFETEFYHDKCRIQQTEVTAGEIKVINSPPPPAAGDRGMDAFM